MALNRIDPAQYESQLATKLAAFKDGFVSLALPEPEVFRSAPLHYRMRVEFRIWHHDGRIDYAMFEREGDEKKVVLIDDFPVAVKPICDLMPRLRDYLQDCEPLRNKLFQIEFLATDSGELMLCLIYHRALDEEWTAQAQGLAERFARDLAVHLALPHAAIGEVDRHLGHTETGAHHAERHLDLEGVALR